MSNKLPPIVQDAAARAGGIFQLAKALGVKHSSIYGWRHIPAGRVLAVERITGIHRSELRPDIYPVEAEQ